MEIVMRRQEMLLLTPNTRWTLPDDVALQLIERGAAEEIKQDVIEQEEKAKKKGK